MILGYWSSAIDPIEDFSIPCEHLFTMATVSFVLSKVAQAAFKSPLTLFAKKNLLSPVTPITSEGNDPQAPISAGFERLEKGKPSIPFRK